MSLSLNICYQGNDEYNIFGGFASASETRLYWGGFNFQQIKISTEIFLLSSIESNYNCYQQPIIKT